MLYALTAYNFYGICLYRYNVTNAMSITVEYRRFFDNQDVTAMQRWMISFVLLLLCAPLWVFSASALTYTDDMTDMEQNNIKTYNGLTPVANTTIPPQVQGAIPGKSAVTFASSRPVGYAEYRVQNAELVTVGIYTMYGTFISPVPGKEPVYALGMYQGNMSHLSGQQVTQAQISRSSGILYGQIGGKLCRLLEVTPYLEFRDTTDRPGDLVDYGVNVYTSNDGVEYNRVPLSMSTQSRVDGMVTDWQRGYVFEQLVYRVPAGATRIRVEINDYQYLDSLQSGAVRRQPPSTGMRSCLSAVSVSGDALSVGVPEPVASVSDSTQSQTSSSQSSSGRSSSEKSSSKKSSAAAAEAAGAGASNASSKAASSKFVGETTVSASSSGASKAKEKDSATQSQSSGASTPSGEETSEEEHSRVQVIRIEPSSRDKQSSAIFIYIVAVGIGILLLLIRGKR